MMLKAEIKVLIILVERAVKVLIIPMDVQVWSTAVFNDSEREQVRF